MSHCTRQLESILVGSGNKEEALIDSDFCNKIALGRRLGTKEKNKEFVLLTVADTVADSYCNQLLLCNLISHELRL